MYTYYKKINFFKLLNKIQKRDGRFVKFEPEKITNAICKAAFSVGFTDKRVCEKLSGQVVRTLETRFPKITPTVEDVQDFVEKTLIKNGYADIAKAYILYREKRTELRETKTFFGIRDDLKLELNAINVLKQRYLLKNEQGRVIETPRQMFQRVAEAVSRADLLYYKKADIKKIEKQFFEAMINLEFLPNSPTLMNAGTSLGQLSACFVLPVEDSIKSIFDAVKKLGQTFCRRFGYCMCCTVGIKMHSTFTLYTQTRGPFNGIVFLVSK